MNGDAPDVAVAVTVPLLTPGHAVGVEVAVPVIEVPELTFTENPTVQPFASLIIAG